MQKIKSKPGLKNFFGQCPQPVQWYFEHLPKLLADFPLDVALAYVFSQVEAAQRMTVYCGAVKLHSCDKDVAWQAVSRYRLTRAEFPEMFETIYGKPVPDAVTRLVVTAEAVRDRVMHGKAATDDDIRNAIAHVLEYAKEMNALIVSLGGPAPFGDLRGFKGAAKSLEKPTSRWVLKGMGFPLQ